MLDVCFFFNGTATTEIYTLFLHDAFPIYIRIKGWEGGAGLTKAGGTAACAAAFFGSILKLNERCVDIEFSTGLLNIDWKSDNNIYMTGKVSNVKKIEINI